MPISVNVNGQCMEMVSVIRARARLRLPAHARVGAQGRSVVKLIDAFAAFMVSLLSKSGTSLGTTSVVTITTFPVKFNGREILNSDVTGEESPKRNAALLFSVINELCCASFNVSLKARYHAFPHTVLGHPESIIA